MMKTFNEIFEDRTKIGTKVKTDEYYEKGAYLIIDQGKNLIAGYTDMKDGLFEDVPAIIFGDHTRVIKYVEEPFFLGADGVKVLRSKYDDANYKYLYYALKNAKIPDTGYNRHFKWLKEVKINYPDIKRQEEIVSVLDKVSSIIESREEELKNFDTLIKSRFVEMFGDVFTNSMEWNKKPLADECDIVTGNTPSRKVSEYYGDYIEWIKSDNINTPNAILTTAEEYLSEEGLKVGRSVDAGSILMTCIAGSIGCIGNVAIADRTVSFNQQINGIVPKENNTWFMYVLFELSKQRIQSTINMALKGILSKGQLSEMEFIFPPVELQNEFGAFVHQVDKLKFEVQKSLDETQLLFDSLMQKYFG